MFVQKEMVQKEPFKFNPGNFTKYRKLSCRVLLSGCYELLDTPSWFISVISIPSYVLLPNLKMVFKPPIKAPQVSPSLGNMRQG